MAIALNLAAAVTPLVITNIGTRPAAAHKIRSFAQRVFLSAKKKPSGKKLVCTRNLEACTLCKSNCTILCRVVLQQKERKRRIREKDSLCEQRIFVRTEESRRKIREKDSLCEQRVVRTKKQRRIRGAPGLGDDLGWGGPSPVMPRGVRVGPHPWDCLRGILISRSKWPAPRSRA